MKRFKTPIIILFAIAVLFKSLFIFPMLGYAIGMGYSFDWHRRNINSLIMSSVFILLWLIVLLVAAKTKSKLLLGIYKYYWLAVIIASVFVISFVLFDIHVFSIPAFFLFIFFMIPIHGIGIDFIAFPLLVAIIIFSIGFFVKQKLDTP